MTLIWLNIDNIETTIFSDGLTTDGNVNFNKIIHHKDKNNNEIIAGVSGWYDVDIKNENFPVFNEIRNVISREYESDQKLLSLFKSEINDKYKNIKVNCNVDTHIILYTPELNLYKLSFIYESKSYKYECNKIEEEQISIGDVPSHLWIEKNYLNCNTSNFNQKKEFFKTAMENCDKNPIRVGGKISSKTINRE